MSYTWINARTDTPNHELSQLHKGPGEFAKQTCVGKVSHHFELELNTLGFWVAPQIKIKSLEVGRTWGHAIFPAISNRSAWYISHMLAKMCCSPPVHKSYCYCQRNIFQIYPENCRRTYIRVNLFLCSDMGKSLPKFVSEFRYILCNMEDPYTGISEPIHRLEAVLYRASI